MNAKPDLAADIPQPSDPSTYFSGNNFFTPSQINRQDFLAMTRAAATIYTRRNFRLHGISVIVQPRILANLRTMHSDGRLPPPSQRDLSITLETMLQELAPDGLDETRLETLTELEITDIVHVVHQAIMAGMHSYPPNQATYTTVH